MVATHIRFLSDTAGVAVGSVLYYAVLTAALFLCGSEYTKLIVAILFVLVLLFDSGLAGRTLKKIFRKRRKGDAGTAIDP